MGPLQKSRRGSHPQSGVGPVHLIAASAILGLLVMPVAFAEVGDPGATKSANLTKQIKTLKRRVKALEAKPDQVGQVPASLPPSGPAGGDLTGSFPNPAIGPSAVGGAEVTDLSLGGADLALDSLSGPQILESGVLIPRAWARVSDPAGNPPAGDPSVAAGEGVADVNDGDGAPLGEAQGNQCFELGFTPDLTLATAATPARRVRIGTTLVADCAAGFDALLSVADTTTGSNASGDLHVAFFDL
jgi:hypothetical protein